MLRMFGIGCLKREQRIPQELWTGRKCEHTQMRPFGSTVYVRDHTYHSKLEPRFFKAMLIGYRSYSESTIRYFNPATKEFNFSRDLQVCTARKGWNSTHLAGGRPRNELQTIQVVGQ